MTLRECFEQFGGDYEGAIRRLGKEERIMKYSKRFAEGNDYELIESSLSAGNNEEAFRNVHNLKGVALNLGLTPLHETAHVLCEALRPGNPPVSEDEIEVMLKNVKTAYDNVVALLLKADD